ncbi:MAG: hypothetical protein ACK4MZ_05975 [Thermomonas haemolytica]
MCSFRTRSHYMLGKHRLNTTALALAMGLSLALPALATQDSAQNGRPMPTHPAKPQPADPQGGILPSPKNARMAPKQIQQPVQQGPDGGRPPVDTPIIRVPATCPPGTVWVPDRHPIDPIPGQPIVIHGECVPKYRPVQQQATDKKQ